MHPAVKYLLLALLAVGCFPAFLIYIFREPIKDWFWTNALSSHDSMSTYNESIRDSSKSSNEEKNANTDFMMEKKIWPSQVVFSMTFKEIFVSGSAHFTMQEEIWLIHDKERLCQKNEDFVAQK